MAEDEPSYPSAALITVKSSKIFNGTLDTQIPIFPGQDIFVGRDPSACFPFFDSSIISRVHFRIYSIIYDDELMTEYPPLIYCEDRGSSNGTYVNNNLIGTISSPRNPYLLNDGDTISIRPYWTFTFQQKTRAAQRKPDDVQKQELELFKNRYTVSSRLLGSGICGNVYLANDELTQKQLACKIVDLRRSVFKADGRNSSQSEDQDLKYAAKAIRARKFAEERQKLTREIEILSKLNHPNIATLHKAFRTPHSLYIFNELAAGGDLFSFLQANGPCLEDLHARVISRQVAIAVEYLHSNGIAHRDLKPENILVMRTDIGHRVVLTDFGCAGYIGIDSGRMLSTVGTYDYVAPEVHRTEMRGYTEAIDMWSMGIITLCLLTGDALISFDSLHKMSQPDIAGILARASINYPQWGDVNIHGKEFVSSLLVLDPDKRLKSRDAINHDWFRKPARISEELDKLYERANRFWSKNLNRIDIIEDLPDVGEANEPQLNISRASGRKRIPDSASPYFGLDRHLQPRGALSRSNLKYKRKRILEHLNGADSRFIVNATLEDSILTNSRPATPLTLSRERSLMEMSASSSLISRPCESSSTKTTIKPSLTCRRGRPTVAQIRKNSTKNNELRARAGCQQSLVSEGSNIGQKELPIMIQADTNHFDISVAAAGSRVRDVEANDLFGTIPAEIRAAQAAEAAYNDPLVFSDYFADGGIEEANLARPVGRLERSYTETQDDHDMHNEVAKELPNVTTAKVFSQALTRKKQAKKSQGKD